MSFANVLILPFDFISLSVSFIIQICRLCLQFVSSIPRHAFSATLSFNVQASLQVIWFLSVYEWRIQIQLSMLWLATQAFFIFTFVVQFLPLWVQQPSLILFQLLVFLFIWQLFHLLRLLFWLSMHQAQLVYRTLFIAIIWAFEFLFIFHLWYV